MRGPLEELELVRAVDEWLLARGAPGELDALGPAETAARAIAGYWHGGQSSALYAFTSSGTMLPGLAGEILRDLAEQAAELAHREELEEIRSTVDNCRELAALLQYVDAMRPAEPCEECGCSVRPFVDGDCPACRVLDEYGTLEVPAEILGAQERGELLELLERVAVES